MSGIGCGTALNGSDAISIALAGDNLMLKTPSVPSNSGGCGDAYYAYTFNNEKSIGLFTYLEKADVGCSNTAIDWFNNSGSYCTREYVQIIK